MVDKDSSWILEKAMTTSRTGSQNALIATSTDTWPKSVGRKKKKEIRKCFKCDKEGYIAKDCKEKQLMKKQRIQEELDEKDNEEKDKKKQSFGEDLLCKFSE